MSVCMRAMLELATLPVARAHTMAEPARRSTDSAERTRRFSKGRVEKKPDHGSDSKLSLAKAQPLFGAVDEVLIDSSAIALQVFRLVNVDGGGYWELAEFMSFFRHIHRAVQKAAGQMNGPRTQLGTHVDFELRPAQYSSGEAARYGGGGLTAKDAASSEPTTGGPLNFPCVEVVVKVALADPKRQGHGIPLSIVNSARVSRERAGRELGMMRRARGHRASKRVAASSSSVPEREVFRTITVRKHVKAAVLRQQRSICEHPVR